MATDSNTKTNTFAYAWIQQGDLIATTYYTTYDLIATMYYVAYLHGSAI